MRTETHIQIELSRPGSLPRVYAVQGEMGSRAVVFALYENGVAWNDTDSTAASVHFRRSDGTGGNFDSTTDAEAVAIADNTVTIVLTEAVCAKAGPVALTVELSADGAVIATWPVTVMVEANPGCQSLVEETEEGSGGSGGATSYVIDATSIKVDISETKIQTASLTDIVDVAGLLAAHEVGRDILLKLGSANYEGGEYAVKLDDYYEANGAHTFNGFVGFSINSYSVFSLTVNSDNSVALHYVGNPMGAVVKTVNGVGPDEDGNVEVETAKEMPIHTDLSGYYDGTIVLGYADGGSMNIAVTFDANGNPISFSNGVEEFTVTWPAEQATEEVTG